MDPVLPGQVIHLPVHLAQTGKMRWRPLGSNFVWSEAQSLRLLLQVPDSQLGLHRHVLNGETKRIQALGHNPASTANSEELPSNAFCYHH